MAFILTYDLLPRYFFLQEYTTPIRFPSLGLLIHPSKATWTALNYFLKLSLAEACPGKSAQPCIPKSSVVASQWATFLSERNQQRYENGNWICITRGKSNSRTIEFTPNILFWKLKTAQKRGKILAMIVYCSANGSSGGSGPDVLGVVGGSRNRRWNAM